MRRDSQGFELDTDVGWPTAEALTRSDDVTGVRPRPVRPGEPVAVGWPRIVVRAPEPPTTFEEMTPLPLPAPFEDDFQTVQTELLEPEEVAQPVPRPVVRARALRRGRICSFFGARGGAGCTSLAVELATKLVRGGRRVVVVDLDLLLGDVLEALALPPATTFAAFARDAADGVVDVERLGRHKSGFYALAQHGWVDASDANIVARIPAVLDALAVHFDAVIVDGLRVLDDHAGAALDASDEIILVTPNDAARRGERVRELFARLGYGDEKVRVIVPRPRRGLLRRIFA